MKVMVTGASGFIGHALCAHLVAQEHTVVPVVRRHNSNVPDALVINANADTVWAEALKGCNSVVHSAAHIHAKYATDTLQTFRAVNVDATLELARRAAAAGVRRFVFISTIKVNGDHTLAGKCFKPSDIPMPSDAYACSKWEAEQGLHKIAQTTGMEIVIIRPPLVYGPGVKGNFAELVKWIKKGFPLPSSRTNARSILALENLISLIARCLDYSATPRAANEVFLVSDAEAVSTAQLLKKIGSAYDRRPWLIPVPMGLMRFFAKLIGKTSVIERLLGSLAVDDTKTRELLDWQPVITIDEQLRRMANATHY